MPTDVRTWGVRLFGGLFQRFVTLKAGTGVTITESTVGRESTLTIAASGGGSGAPTSSQYVTLATDATLTAERVLTPGHGLDLVDGGAGSTVTLDVDETELDHSAITTGMAWTSSGHTGTASRIAAFDGGGAAAYYQIGVDVQAYDAGLASLASVDTAAGQPYTTAANTYALATVTTPVPNAGETWTRTVRHGRMVDLFSAGDVADAKASPPSGWVWSSTTNVSTAVIASGVLTITTTGSGSFNTPSDDHYLYFQRPGASRWRVLCHLRCTANESFEGGYFRYHVSASNRSWLRLGPVTNTGDVDAYDGVTAQTPVAMTAGDWFWLMIECNGTVIDWWIQTNGTADSAMPTELGSSATSTWLYAGHLVQDLNAATAAPRIGLGVLRAGSPSGSWQLICNHFRIYYE